MYRPPTEDTGNPETQTATDQKKKTKTNLLQKESGLGPGKRNLARQKTFRHKLLNPSQSMVLVKNTDSWAPPKTSGVSNLRVELSALCFDRSSKWCWCLLKFQNHWYGLFFRWRNLRREAGWFAPGNSLYSLVLVLDLPRMPLLVLKSYENRGNFKDTFELC